YATEGLAVFDVLPPAARDAIMHGPVNNDGQQVDPRLQLAAASIILGHRDRATAFIENVKPEELRDEHAPITSNQFDLIHALLEPPTQDDPYFVLAPMIDS